MSHIRTAASRCVIDQLTRIVMSIGGLLVLLALLLFFCYLLWVVLPLFRAPAVGVVTDLSAYSAPAWYRRDAEADDALLTLGVDANAGWAWAIDRAGQGIARLLNGARVAEPVPLVAQPMHVAAASGGQPLYWLTAALGQVVLARVDSAAGGAPVWLLPFGGAQTIDPARRPLRRITLAYPDAERAVAAAQLADGTVVVLNYNSTSTSTLVPTPTSSVTSTMNSTTIATTEVGAGAVQRLRLTTPGQEVDRLLLSPDGHLLYLLSSSQLSIWRLDAGGALPCSTPQRR